MHWLIHNKFDYDPKVRNLIDNLERLSIDYTRASVVPFSTDGISFEDDTTIDSLQAKKIFTYGSYTMANIASKLFSPGAFISPNISMIELTKNYGSEMLNSDMIVGSIKDLDPDFDSFFIRPVEDTKSIVGEVYTKEYFKEWKQKILDTSKEFPDNYTTVTPDTLICIAPCKSIEAEYRCFVVNDKVATVSQYRSNGRAYFSSSVDSYIVDYVNDLIKTWKPDKAFVLDVALLNGTLKAIEANCINSSGLYEIDTQKLIMAVEEL